MLKRWALVPVLAVLAFAAFAAANPGVASADPRDFTLVNEHPTVTITHVYVGPSSSDDWGEDILGRDVLLPGESVFIYFERFTPGDCFYDIKVVYADGDEGILWAVNLCETDTVTFR